MAARRGTKELHLMMGDRLLGVLVQTADTGRLELKYDDAYLSNEGSQRTNGRRCPVRLANSSLSPFIPTLSNWRNPQSRVGTGSMSTGSPTGWITPSALFSSALNAHAWNG